MKRSSVFIHVSSGIRLREEALADTIRIVPLKQGIVSDKPDRGTPKYITLRNYYVLV